MVNIPSDRCSLSSVVTTRQLPCVHVGSFFYSCRGCLLNWWSCHSKNTAYRWRRTGELHAEYVFTAHLETVLVYGWFGFVFVWGRVVGNEQSGSNKSFLEKDVFSPCHKRGSEEKFWVPMRNQTSDLGFRTSMLYHWATETLWLVRSTMKFIWHISCILLRSEMSIVIFSCYVSLPHGCRKTMTMTDWDKSLKH